MQQFGAKDYNQMIDYIGQQEVNLRKYASFETKTRDRQLAHDRGKIEAILQAIESVIATINLHELSLVDDLTQEDRMSLAERAARYVENARRVLNQPRDTYRPDAKMAFG